MKPAKNSSKSIVMWIVLIAGLIAFVFYMIFYVDLKEVASTLTKTNLTIYAAAFIAYLSYTFFSAMVWHRLLKNLSAKITKTKAFLYTWVGLFFDATIPQLGWSGEVSKTYLLAKDSKVETGKIGASVVGQKIISMTLTITALSAGLLLILFKYTFPIESTLLICLVLFLSIVALVFVYYVSIKPSATKKILNWGIKILKFFRKNWNNENFRIKADGTLDRFHLDIDQLKSNPKGLIRPIIFAICGFIFEVSVVFLSFAALGQPLPVDVVLIVFTLTGTLQTVGVAFFGFPELIMSMTFMALYIDPAVAVSVTLLTRAVNLWFRLVVSYVTLQIVGIKILKQNNNKELVT